MAKTPSLSMRVLQDISKTIIIFVWKLEEKKGKRQDLWEYKYLKIKKKKALKFMNKKVNVESKKTV